MNNKGLILNNKGFTLIELLAVVAILAAFAVVAVTNVSASLKKSDTNKEETQLMLLKTAAKIYFSNNGTMVSNEKVCVSTLIEDGYIDAKSIDIYNKPKQCVLFNGSYYTLACSDTTCK